MSLIAFVGNSMGAGYKETAKNYARIGFWIALCINLSGVIIFFLMRDYLAEQLLPEHVDIMKKVFMAYNIVL